jgi:predicted nucleic acid-binding protein
LRLIDTNVVIYAAGKAHLLQEEARRVLDRIAEGALHANVDAELLQEILHVYSARKERAKRFDTIDDLLVLFPNPIPIAREEIETARNLMRVNSFLGARDAIHAAVVQTHDLEGIVTADKVFDRIKGVKRFDLK